MTRSSKMPKQAGRSGLDFDGFKLNARLRTDAWRAMLRRRAVADNLILSLTSFPLRAARLHLVIRSLLNQSLRASKIVLYLAVEEFPDRSVPRNLRSLVGRRFEVRFVRENLRSFNKLLHALDDFPDSTIVTCDDDRIYGNDCLARLWEAHQATPGTIIHTLGRRMTLNSGNWFAPYAEWPHDQSRQGNFFTLPLGTFGVLYPAGCLNPWIRDRAALLKHSPRQDDIWFKAVSLANDIPVRASGGDASDHSDFFIPNDVALWPDNFAGQNDRALIQAFGHFGLTPDVIRAKEDKLASMLNETAGSGVAPLQV